MPVEAAILAGKCQKVFLAAFFAFHTGKAVIQITAVKINIFVLKRIQIAILKLSLDGSLILI